MAYGIPESQILEFAEWVGGRYHFGPALASLSPSDRL